MNELKQKRRIAIDFGTTNTVIAYWDQQNERPQTLCLSGVSKEQPGQPPLIPSLFYKGEQKNHYGEQVWAMGEAAASLRLFSAFKKEIAAQQKSMEREIDDQIYTFARAAKEFLVHVLHRAAQGEAVEAVVTFPVDHFENYKRWLLEEVGEALPGATLHAMDESTAAAVGYGVAAPGRNVMVIDFGGGTLDVSVVRTPRVDAKDPIEKRPVPTVIAKAGAYIGGEDIDWFLLQDVLRQLGLSNQVRAGQALRREAQRVKIALSECMEETFHYTDERTGEHRSVLCTRQELEAILERNNVFTALHHALHDVLMQMTMKGLGEGALDAVMLVGGTCRIPAVQRSIRQMFGVDKVKLDKPMEAVAHGALLALQGSGVADYITHSYAIRFLDPHTRRHGYRTLFVQGTAYPTQKPLELTLSCSHNAQAEIELVIAEIGRSMGVRTEVYLDEFGRLVTEEIAPCVDIVSSEEVVLLTGSDEAYVARLDPVGETGDGRLRVAFEIDANKRLLASITDNKTQGVLVHRAPVAELE